MCRKVEGIVVKVDGIAVKVEGEKHGIYIDNIVDETFRV